MLSGIGKNEQVRTRPLVSNANQSPVPVGSKPIDRHFHSPTPSVNKLHAMKTSFCSVRVPNDLGFCDVDGAKDAKAVSRVFQTFVI